MTTLLIPFLAAVVGFYAWTKHVNAQSAFMDGAKNGIATLMRIFPALLFLLPSISVLRASGLLDALTSAFSPILNLVHIPEELAPVLILRPFSGSGALAAATEIMKEHGADTLIGRIAAVMLGSTETTFYVLAVYFAGLGKAPDRRILPCALIADAVGFIAAAITVRLWFP